MAPGLLLAALLLLVGSPPAVAAPAAPAVGQERAPLTRVELALEGGWHTERLDEPGIAARATGEALSGLALAASWWRSGARLGVAAQLRAARLEITGGPGMRESERVSLTGGAAVGALAMRAGGEGGLGLEGQLGYGWHRLAAVAIDSGPAGDLRLAGGAAEGHGPALSLRLHRGLGDRLSIDLGGQGIPRLLGGRYRGQAVTAWQVEGRAALSAKLARAGRAGFWATLAYLPALTRFSGGGDLSLAQRRHQIALALAVEWGRAPVVLATPVPPAQAPPKVAPAPRPSVVAGLVRSEDGQPVAARVRVVELGLEVSADARGAFQLEVPAGQYTLQIEAPGFVGQAKTLSAAAGERRIYNVDLARERP